MATWIVELSVVLLVTMSVASVLWHLAGSRLPPASLVDEQGLAAARETLLEEHDANAYVGVSGVVYQGIILDTVTARSWIIDGLMLAYAVVMLNRVDAQQWATLEEVILRKPSLFASVALVFLLLSTLVGAYRWMYDILKRNMGALPALDEAGRLVFTYVGDGPHRWWLYSPWFRSATWAVVAVLAVGGVLIATPLVSDAFALGGEPLVGIGIGAITARFLISALLAGIAVGHESP